MLQVDASKVNCTIMCMLACVCLASTGPDERSDITAYAHECPESKVRNADGDQGDANFGFERARANRDSSVVLVQKFS